MKAPFVLILAFVFLSNGSARDVRSTEGYNKADPRKLLQSLLFAGLTGRPQGGPGYSRSSARREVRPAMYVNELFDRRGVIAGGFAASLLGTEVLAEEATDAETLQVEVEKLELSLEDEQAKTVKLQQSLQEAKTALTAAKTSKEKAESNMQKEMTRAESMKAEVSKLEPLLQEAKKEALTLEKLVQETRKTKEVAAQKLQQRKEQAESISPEEVGKLSAILDSEVASLEQSLQGAKAKVAEFEESKQDAMTKATAAKTLLEGTGAPDPKDVTNVEKLESEVVRVEKLLGDAKTKVMNAEQSLEKAKTNAAAAEKNGMDAKAKAQEEARRAANLQNEVVTLEKMFQEEGEKVTTIESEITKLQQSLQAVGLNQVMSIVAISGLVLAPLIARAVFPPSVPEKQRRSTQPPSPPPMPANQPTYQPVNQPTNQFPNEPAMGNPMTYDEYLAERDTSDAMPPPELATINQQPYNQPASRISNQPAHQPAHHVRNPTHNAYPATYREYIDQQGEVTYADYLAQRSTGELAPASQPPSNP